jgi:hypothetical protein
VTVFVVRGAPSFLEQHPQIVSKIQNWQVQLDQLIRLELLERLVPVMGSWTGKMVKEVLAKIALHLKRNEYYLR